jgi:hypothetical protein
MCTGDNAADNHWNAISLTQDYKERISYFGNDNILTYLRNARTGWITWSMGIT